jgi:hypothetical protein
VQYASSVDRLIQASIQSINRDFSPYLWHFFQRSIELDVTLRCKAVAMLCGNEHSKKFGTASRYRWLYHERMAVPGTLLPFVKSRLGVPGFIFSAWNNKMLTPLKK